MPGTGSQGGSLVSSVPAAVPPPTAVVALFIALRKLIIRGMVLSVST
jgi:hypothetical protein